MSSSVGMIIPNIWKTKKCSKHCQSEATAVVPSKLTQTYPCPFGNICCQESWKMGGWSVFFSQPTNGNSVQIQTYGTHALKSLFCLTYPLLSQNYCRIYQRTHNPKLPKLEIVIIHLSFHQWTFRALEAAILSLVILQNHAYTSYFVKQGRFRTTKNYWWKVPTWKIIRSHWRMDHPPLEFPWWNLSMTNRLYDVIWLK